MYNLILPIRTSLCGLVLSDFNFNSQFLRARIYIYFLSQEIMPGLKVGTESEATKVTAPIRTLRSRGSDVRKPSASASFPSQATFISQVCWSAKAHNDNGYQEDNNYIHQKKIAEVKRQRRRPFNPRFRKNNSSCQLCEGQESTTETPQSASPKNTNPPSPSINQPTKTWNKCTAFYKNN
jgi:hypothetical protein